MRGRAIAIGAFVTPKGGFANGFAAFGVRKGRSILENDRSRMKAVAQAIEGGACLVVLAGMAKTLECDLRISSYNERKFRKNLHSLEDLWVFYLSVLI